MRASAPAFDMKKPAASDMSLAAGGDCRKSSGTQRYGKEDSYERNPGRVSFVFNHKIMKLFQSFMIFFSLSKKYFDKLKNAAEHCSAAFF